MVDPISGESHEVETVPLELLPKSLTKLRIGSGSRHFFVSGSCSSLFPPHLKSFDALHLKLAPNAAKQLPASLTFLSTYHFYEQLCEHLPQGLTSLSFSNVLLSPKTIQGLPKSLTELNSRFSTCKEGEEYWIDFKTGEKEKVLLSSLPEYSVHKDYATYFAYLPPNLTSVELMNFVELQDGFIQNQNFSNLLSLTLSRIDQLTDDCVPKLNRHLTHLDVSPSAKITGKCFKSLPRSLTILYLRHSSSIFDEDIQHLPRTLQQLWIDQATHLSNACVRDFPVRCYLIYLSKNTKITQQCIPDLPMQAGTFVGANWTRMNGKVKEQQ